MGADFIFAAAIVPTPAEVEKIKRNIDALTLDTCPEPLVCDHDFTEGDDQTLANIKAHLLECLSTLEDADVRRDSGYLLLGDRSIVITGGMTWGDDPSDLCDPIWQLENAGVLEPKWADFEFRRKAVDPALVSEAAFTLDTIAKE